MPDGTRWATVVLGAIAGTTVVGHVQLLAGTTTLGTLSTLGLVAGGVLGLAHRTPPPTASPPADRRIAWASAAVLAVTFAALVVGVLATPARAWDGVVGWELRTRALAAEPSLEQPFFAAPEVFAHTREYPLLQPLLLAQAARWFGPDVARLWFPLLWLTLLGVAAGAWRRRGLSARDTWLATVALGATPMLVGPTSGAVDSGYAEITLAAFLTAALTPVCCRRRRRRRLLCGPGPWPHLEDMHRGGDRVWCRSIS